jgi:hypothetical protein
MKDSGSTATGFLILTKLVSHTFLLLQLGIIWIAANKIILDLTDKSQATSIASTAVYTTSKHLYSHLIDKCEWKRTESEMGVLAFRRGKPILYARNETMESVYASFYLSHSILAHVLIGQYDKAIRL